MSIDVAAAREQTPGTAPVAHLNNAGVSLPAARTTDAVIAHLRLEASIRGCEAAAASSRQVQRCYSAVAELLSCAAHEVAIVENATRAWDMAFYGFRFALGDKILTGCAEYASNAIAMLQVAARTSVSAAGSARFDLPHRGLTEVVRASVHYYNDDDDLQRLLSALPLPS